MIAETFVDPSRFQGTAYKASGWTLLGKTKGFERLRGAFGGLIPSLLAALERPRHQQLDH